MITDAYNRNAETLFSDNSAIVEQGGFSKKTIVAANKNCEPLDHAPAYKAPAPVKSQQMAISFSKSLKRDEEDNNPISREMCSDGLGALFGAATGLDGIEMIIDYGCDLMEFRDEYVADRPQYHTAPAPQPDPRIWMQPAMPMPSYGIAA